MSTAGQGRRDRSHPFLSRTSQANLTLVLLLSWMAATWHLTVAWLTPTGLSQLEVTARGTVTGELPGNPSWLVLFGVWLLLMMLGATLATLVLIRFKTWRRSRTSGKGMATRSEVKHAVGVDAARKESKWSRPSLAEGEKWKRASANEVGFVLGTEKITGQEVVLPNNAFLVVFGPTGAKKTNAIVVPRCLNAPGALVVTTNETGLLDLIATHRQTMGRLWVFDPDDRAQWPEEMTWDPTVGAQDPKRALARAGAFADGCLVNTDTKNGGFFKGQASAALRACFHAAALDDRSSEDVLRWTLNLEATYETPVRLIKNSPDPATSTLWADRLQDVATGAEETVSSTRNTLNQIIDPLLLPSVMRWVTRRDGVPNFDPDKFVRSTDTLVLISDASSSTNVGPLTAMLYQEVMDAVKRAAPFLPGRTLDPPLAVVGDEIANVAPIEKMPEMCTEVRKLGVHKTLIFQGFPQLTIRWGAERGELLVQQQAAEMVLPGLKDVKTLERYSDLAGISEVLEGSSTYDSNGIRTSHGMDVRERKTLRADEIRKMPDGEALLVWRNASPMILNLKPWFSEPNADQIQAAADKVQQRRIDHLMKKPTSHNRHVDGAA